MRDLKKKNPCDVLPLSVEASLIQTTVYGSSKSTEKFSILSTTKKHSVPAKPSTTISRSCHDSIRWPQ